MKVLAGVAALFLAFLMTALLVWRDMTDGTGLPWYWALPLWSGVFILWLLAGKPWRAPEKMMPPPRWQDRFFGN
jgi:hypothetical protein